VQPCGKGTDYRPVCSVPILVAQLQVARPPRAGDVAVGDLADLADLAGVWAQAAFGRDVEPSTDPQFIDKVQDIARRQHTGAVAELSPLSPPSLQLAYLR